MNAKVYKNTIAVKQESLKAKYTFFVTLTYAPKHLPTIHIDFGVKTDENGNVVYDKQEEYYRKKLTRYEKMHFWDDVLMDRGLPVQHVRFRTKTKRMIDYYGTDIIEEFDFAPNRHYDFLRFSMCLEGSA